MRYHGNRNVRCYVTMLQNCSCSCQWRVGIPRRSQSLRRGSGAPPSPVPVTARCPLVLPRPRRQRQQRLRSRRRFRPRKICSLRPNRYHKYLIPIRVHMRLQPELYACSTVTECQRVLCHKLPLALAQETYLLMTFWRWCC